MKSKIAVLMTLLSTALMAVQGNFKSEEIPKVGMDKILPLLTQMQGTVPAQWRISWSGNPSKEATISWTTAEPGTKHVVYYGTKATKGDLKRYTKRQEAYRNGQYKGSVDNPNDPKEDWAYYHHVKLKGLKPGTRYYFTIRSDREKSREFYFITAPTKTKEFYFLNGADSRTGHTERCKMNLRMTQLMEDNPKILALVHGGDYAHQGSWWSHWRLWLSHNELLTASDGRILPIIPARGNHEPWNIYGEVFDTDFFHVTILPLNTTLITLDSNGPRGVNDETIHWPEKDQGEWFKRKLSEYGRKSRWLIMNYHGPIYPAVKGRNGIIGAWENLFDQYKVDLALEADGHCIKFTKPIRNGEIGHPEGTYYIGEGGLGVKSRGPKNRPFIEKIGRGAHVFQIHVTPSNMNVKCVLLDSSKEWGEFDIKRKSHSGK